MKITRRNFIRSGIGIGSTFAIGGGIAFGNVDSDPGVVRPPGAKKGTGFQKSCIRCFQCGTICPNKAIKSLGVEGGLANIFTPYLKPREQGCILCMKCSQICPTDAIEKIPKDEDVIQKRVKMGVAWVDVSLCYSYNGRICGVCYYACPYPDSALTLMSFAQPVIDPDKCVGCGLCEKSCIHIPQAVRVYTGGTHA